MSVISISILESPIQIVSGVPKSITVTIANNAPGTIFYTLNGENPTINDMVVVGPIDLTTPGSGIVFKCFATNGITTSAIITQIYGSIQAPDTRRPRDKVIGLASGQASQNYGVFGSNSPNPNITWGNTGGTTVDDPNVQSIPDGYAGFGDGTRSNATDLPLEDYQFIKTTTNYLGETGRGIGNLPSIKILIPPTPPTSSDTSKKLFNPRALVIIQDGREPPADPNLVMINRQDFTLQGGSDDNGTEFSKTGMEGSVSTGSFVRQFYNPREQTITYYYHDSKSLRWVISTEPYVAKNANLFNYSLMVMPSRGGIGAKYCYGWRAFQRRVLF